MSVSLAFGRRYRVSATVWGTDSVPPRGMLRVWELGAFEANGTQEKGEASFNAVTGWSTVSADLCMSNARNSSRGWRCGFPAGRPSRLMM